MNIYLFNLNLFIFFGCALQPWPLDMGFFYPHCNFGLKKGLFIYFINSNNQCVKGGQFYYKINK